MICIVMFQFMEKASFKSMMDTVNRIVTTGHSGKAGAGTGIPASDSYSPGAVLGFVIH